MLISDVMGLAPVIPVLVIDEVSHARPIAEALVAGGLPALEVTLRTSVALEVISEMSKVAGATVGAGTVTSAAQVGAATRAGARFVVSPGLTTPVTEAALSADVPYLPGVATAADIMRGLDHGLNCFKFFPAEAAGGSKALAALAAPFFQSKFCPTGGVTLSSAPEWLSIPAVSCVGGSWIVPNGAPNFHAIYERARAASQLGSNAR